jgi:hypothetical protein
MELRDATAETQPWRIRLALTLPDGLSTPWHPRVCSSHRSQDDSVGARLNRPGRPW